MLWTVTYKDKSGNVDKMEMEAENRAIVIGDMRKKGLTVVNIIDGGLKANSKKPKNRAAKLNETANSSSAAMWVVLILLALIGGGVAWWYCSGQPNLLETLSGETQSAPAPTTPARKPTGKAVIRIAD